MGCAAANLGEVLYTLIASAWSTDLDLESFVQEISSWATTSRTGQCNSDASLHKQFNLCAGVLTSLEDGLAIGCQSRPRRLQLARPGSESLHLHG